MKRIFIILFVLTFTLFGAETLYAQDKIVITGTEAVRSGGEVVVTFRVQTEKRAVKRNFSHALSPVITDGEHKVSFPAIIVQGKRAARISARNEKISGHPVDRPGFSAVQPGESLSYSGSVPFQQWMEGAALIVENHSWGCCNSEAHSDRLLASNVISPALPVETVVAEPGPKTTGDKLAHTFSFVIPDSQWNEAEPIYDEDRERALVVYYHVSRSDIQPDYRGNRLTLNNIAAAVNTIIESADSRVSRIVVVGFTSPEGPFKFNDKLAWDRAVSVKNHIVKNTGIQESSMVVANGSEDWRGLRAMVAASDLHDKAQILHIIDTVPITSADGRRKERLNRIQALGGGASYRYMLQNFFPKLRSGAFIRVYYENK